jgi:L-fuconolactonase
MDGGKGQLLCITVGRSLGRVISHVKQLDCIGQAILTDATLFFHWFARSHVGLPEGSPLLRIDAHHHLWRYTEQDYRWIGDDMRSLRCDFLLPDLQAEMQAARIHGAVAVQARQTLEETRWLLELAAVNSPILGVVGWLPIADRRFPAILEAMLPSPRLKGLRHVVQGEADGFLDGNDFNRGIDILQSAGLAYDLLIYPRQLQEASRFVDRHPGQSFVLDHAAKPDIRHDGLQAWSLGLRELARRPNISCKISGMVTEADFTLWSPQQLRPYLDVMLQAFGPQRLMIGTDWPVLTVACTYTQWWNLVEQWAATLSVEEHGAILGRTAARIYDLDVPPAGDERLKQVGAAFHL